MRSPSRGSLLISRRSFTRSAFASVSENVVSNTRVSGIASSEKYRAVQRDDRFPCASRPGDARRPGKAALDERSLRGMKEDRPLVPWRVESALKLFDVAHHAETPLRIGMLERIGVAGAGAAAAGLPPVASSSSASAASRGR